MIKPMGFLNGNDNRKPDDMDDKIVVLPGLAERDRIAREKARLHAGPVINMPPVTKSLIALLLAVHLLLAFALSPEQRDAIVENFGFMPERFHTDAYNPTTWAGLVTHIFLHGGWMHLAMNVFMLAAFGSGVEKWLGPRRMLIVFFVSALFGAAAHYALNIGSPYPMIGASGAISGLFAAAIVMMNRGQREMGGRVGILPFALLWIGLSIGFGMLGGPDGSIIAWAAHVGGFLGGFAVLKAMRV